MIHTAPIPRLEKPPIRGGFAFPRNPYRMLLPRSSNVSLHPSSEKSMQPPTLIPDLKRLNLLVDVWSTDGEWTAIQTCKRLTEDRPAAARVAVLEAEELVKRGLWVQATGLPVEASDKLIENLGGSTATFFGEDRNMVDLAAAIAPRKSEVK